MRHFPSGIIIQSDPGISDPDIDRPRDRLLILCAPTASMGPIMLKRPDISDRLGY